jgi:hypothetical protein
VVGIALELDRASLAAFHQHAASGWAFRASGLVDHPHVGGILLVGSQEILEEPFLRIR